MRLNNPFRALQALSYGATGTLSSPIKPGGKQQINCAELDQGRIEAEKKECEEAAVENCDSHKAEFGYGQETGGGPNDCYMWCKCVEEKKVDSGIDDPSEFLGL